MTATQCDNLQFLAFHSIWKHLFRRNAYERFYIAITATCDDALGYSLKKHPELINEWIEKYSKYTSVLD